MSRLNLENYKSSLSFSNKLKRLLWSITWFIISSIFIKKTFNGFKIFVLKIFGARLGSNTIVYSSCRIYQPWKLEMGDNSTLGPETDCYNVDKVTIGSNVVVSQKVYLCTASHDAFDDKFPLITAPILINDSSWVCASSFIGMGVVVGEGAVIGATSSVYKDVEPWHVVGGNPSKFIKKREYYEKN